MAEVRTKRIMREMLKAGKFGLTMKIWSSPEDFLESGYEGFVWLCQSRRTGGRCEFHVSSDLVSERFAAWILEGEDPQYIQICEEPPNERQILTGEVMLSELHYDLTYSQLKIPQRLALQQDPHYASGLTALAIMRSTMDPSSFEDVMVLFDEYPDAVVEFHCFSCTVGPFGRNTFIGEVRNY